MAVVAEVVLQHDSPKPRSFANQQGHSVDRPRHLVRAGVAMQVDDPRRSCAFKPDQQQ
jgi:hypothetical protein